MTTEISSANPRITEYRNRINKSTLSNLAGGITPGQTSQASSDTVTVDISATTATMMENSNSAASQVRDVQMAEEVLRYSTTRMLQNTETAMLAQANQSPEQLMQMFR
jgi:flagellin